MFYYKINFTFINETVNLEDADEALYWYLATLYKNGNCLRDYKVVANEHGYEVYIGMYDTYPIEEKAYRNKYIDEGDSALKNYFDVSYELLEN